MDLALVINLRARRGSAQVAEHAHRLFPEARVALTTHLEEMESWVERLGERPPHLLLAGGGDGTITALLNALRRKRLPFPPLGVLPLGTGNAWARVTNAPRPKTGLDWLKAWGLDSPLPMRSFRLVNVEGHVAPFAGTGWDAEIVSDFKHRLQRWPAGPLRQAHTGIRGYLAASFTRTVPRHLFGEGSANVQLFNAGADALTVDATGSVRPIPGGGDGALLHAGPASATGASTTTQFGFGFRAFPHAHLLPHRLNVRVYGAGALEAVRHAVKLWRGAPVPRMYDFFVEKVRMRFDRVVPFQIAGDLMGERREVELSLDPEPVQLLDWRRLSPKGPQAR